MADRTLTINHAGGDSETYTLKTEDVLGVRVMSVDGQEVTVDRTAPDAIRGVMVDDDYSIVYDLQGDAVKTLYVDGSAITIDRSDERSEVLPYDFATYGTPEYAYSAFHDFTGTGMNIVQFERDGDNTRSDFTETEIKDGTAVAWASAGGGNGNARLRTLYNQGSASGANVWRNSTSQTPKIIENGVLLPHAEFDGVNDFLQSSSGVAPMTGDFTLVSVVATRDDTSPNPAVSVVNTGSVNNRITHELRDTVILAYNPDGTARTISPTDVDIEQTYITSALAGSGRLDVFLDGSSKASEDITGVTSNGLNRFDIGRSRAGNQYGEINFKSLIIYENRKSDDEHAKMIESVKKTHDNTIYLLLEMGQSNSVTLAAPAVIEPYPEQDSEVMIKMSAGTDSGNNDGSINEANQTTNGAFELSSDYPNAYGAERAFARRIQGLLERKVAIVKFSRNGRNIARWNNTGNGNYKDFWPSYLSSAKASLEAQGYTVKTIFHWNQGHADCQWGRGASYQTNLETLIADVRSTVSEPDMPVIIGRTYADVNHVELPNSNETDYNNVRAAQEAVGGQANCCWYNRDSMQFRDEHTHFTKEEYQREGSSLMWDAYFSKFFSY